MGRQWTMAWVLAGLIGASGVQASVQLQVVDRDSGQILGQYSDGSRLWIAGEPGHRYAIELYNASHERVLAVLSVDGVNVISGQTAGFDQGGYVLDPWERISVEGWRKSLQNVAEFEFTRLPDSYAARTGRPGNVGVIGVAVFAEARPLVWHEPVRPRPKLQSPSARDDAGAGSLDKRAPASQPGARRSAESFAGESLAAEEAERQYLGTGHGQQSWSPARQTQFRRASSRPQQISELYYDDTTRLVALGILPRPYRDWTAPRRPQAFPGFVPDPPQAQRPRHPRWPRG